jgi:4-amino-4-deoxy-L-arabinose transferase-like glycosyltransferase
MTKSLLEDRRTLWIVAAITILLFLVANLPWQLDDYDQAKQAFTSFEMIKEARWFYQQTPHAHVATKPPLIGWISAGLFELTRSWDLAWRLPSFLTAVAISILLFRAAAVAYGSSAALIALSAFGLNLLSPRLATLVRTDMPLTLVIFLIGLLIWQKVRHGEPWNKRDHLLVFVLLTGAMLIKGPIVYAFLLPGIGIFEWQRRSNNGPSVWCGWWPWVASLGVFLLWVVGGMVFQPGFFDEVVVREFVARFGETIHRSQPIYFYLPHLLHKFLPWSVLIIALAVLDLRSRGWKIRAAFREISPETFWLSCWVLGGLLAMSLIPSKRVDRIFPVLPPLCLLLAAQVARCKPCSHGSVSRPSMSVDFDLTGHRPVATEEKEASRARVYQWSGVALLLSILVTGGYTISKVVSGYRNHRDALAVFGRDVRHEAEVHNWRYEAIGGKDEGVLLYVRRLRFVEPEDAIAKWKAGIINAVVAPDEERPRLLRDLEGSVPARIRSWNENDDRIPRYILLTRS